MQVHFRIAVTAEDWLRDLADQALGVVGEFERTAFLALWIVLQGAGVDVHAVLAALEADEGAQPTAWRAEGEAAALTVVANHGHERWVLLVHVADGSCAAGNVHGAPRRRHVATNVRPVGASAFSRNRQVWTNFQLRNFK